MNGRENTTPSIPQSMTQPLPVSSSLPSSSVYSSLLPLNPGEDIDPLSKHYRSVSMDSCFNDYLKPPPASGYNISSTSLADGDENTFGLESRNEVYTADEWKKIREDTKLTEIAYDPKKVRIILANREAAARSKKKKAQYIIELEDRVKFLKNEKSLREKKIAELEQEITLKMNVQKEIRIRHESLEQQAQIRDETERLEATATLTQQESEEAHRLNELLILNEQLRIEVQRLRIATGEVTQDDGRFDGPSTNQTDPNMFQQLAINEFNQPQTNPEEN